MEVGLQGVGALAPTKTIPFVLSYRAVFLREYSGFVHHDLQTETLAAPTMGASAPEVSSLIASRRL